MTSDTLWQTKLAARIHDPAEKALVLLRDPAGHEGGSIVEVGKAVGFETHWITRRDGSQIERLHLPSDMERIVGQADRWAAAADRAQFPRDDKDRFVSWAQVRFAERGELVHPLSGERYAVHGIGQDVLAGHIRAASTDLFKSLIHRNADGAVDLQLTALAFWRFGPELGRELQGIGHLWSLLPADTRTPDHSIWQHLDLTSALAGAMTDGGRPALLTVSIGPVQEFIATGRSTSDLWASSHFLSMLAWQAMQVIAAEYGPDAILFPQLRAVPVVDLWLNEQGLRAELFGRADRNDTATDHNPLFVAALPNKFVALVPEQAAAQLAARIRDQVRDWVLQTARAMLDRVLEEIGETPNGQHCYAQIEAQLRDFPQVHWSLVPWLGQPALEDALKPFYPADENKRPGLFGTKVWDTLTAPIEPQQGWRFWEPNDGTLYPAVHDLGERYLAAAKAARPFGQLQQQGYRDALTGEYEWLTLDEKQLTQGSPRQRTDTLWARVARQRPNWGKGDKDGRKAEHLSAFGLIKRLWPEQFAAWVRASRWYRELPTKPDLTRYVVSTHVMAVAPAIERLMEHGPAGEKAHRAYDALAQTVAEQNLKRLALPRRLMRKELRNEPWWETASRLPALLEQASERTDEAEEDERVERVLGQIEKAVGHRVERYYALLLMDGDRLGAWLSGEQSLAFEQSFHEQVKAGLAKYRHPALDAYLQMRRPVSPSRHMAISSALNGFALDLVRHVVESECLGKVLYAGGDDVMAMLGVRDLFKAMALLRAAYSGNAETTYQSELRLNGGFVGHRDRLYQVMGRHATASTGAVIAHHQAPLGAVMRELRAAEKRAKNEGGRDAFSITVIKRSGGALYLTEKWGEPVALLGDTIAFLADPAVSRRAVYHSVEWLTDLPDPKDQPDMLAALLGYQLARQAQDSAKAKAPELARRLAALASSQQKNGLYWLRNFLSVAEFLARETRAGAPDAQPAATAQGATA